MAALIFVLTGCRQQPVESTPAASGPDVFLITIDTLRADRISPYGYRKPTPALDAFATDSVLFERTTSQVPLTLPSHASIMTGLYPATHGVRENSGFVLSAEHRTLAEALKDNGYTTAAFVGAFVLDRRFGLNHGFDTYHDDFATGTLDDVQLGIQERRAGEVLDRTRAWLASNPGKPRFAWVHLYDPHAPYEPPPPFDREDDLYDGEVRYVDSALGDFFRFLQERRDYGPAMIIVTSDHGEGLGEHGEETHGMFLYESTLRVPLMIKYPGNRNAGTRVQSPVQLVDVFPTVLEILAIRDRASTQGRAFRPGSAALNDRPEPAETVLPYLGYGWSPLRALTEYPFKYIAAPRPELYNLENDPKEMRNLAATDPATGDRLRSRLAESFTRLSATEQPAAGKVDAETARRLRALGYVATSNATSLDHPPRGLADPKDKISIFESIWKAEDQLAAGESAEAARVLEGILVRDREVYLAHWLLGLAYYRQNRFEDAYQRFTTASSLRPDESRAFMYAGLSALRIGRIPEARRALEKASALQPDDDTIMNNLGSLYLQTREWDKAARIFVELTGRNEKDVAAWTNLGVVYLYKKDLGPAYDSFQQALTLNPGVPEVHNNLGMVEFERGRIDAAIASYRRAIALRPEYGRAHYNLALALQRKGLKAEAESEFALARQAGR